MVDKFSSINGSGLQQSDSQAILGRSPMVSVILPTYNRLNWLAESIQSVLDQTFQDFEIIVVNDGGEDVGQITQNFNDKRLIYLQHSQNLGLSIARNTGLSVARGKYIAYLDDDDIYYQDHLAILIGYLENHPEKWVAYTDAIYSNLEKQGQDYIETSREVKYSYDFDSYRFLYENYIPVLCIIHRQDCLEKTGLFNPKLNRLEDWDLWMRMSRHYEFTHIKETTCEVRWRSDRSTMMSQGKEALFFAYLNIIHNNINLLHEDTQSLVNAYINSELDNFHDALHEKLLFNNLDLVDIFGIDDLDLIIKQINDLNERFNNKYSQKFLKILALLYSVEKNFHAYSEIKSKIRDIERSSTFEKEQVIQTLSIQAAEKEQNVAILQAQLAEKEQQATTLQARMVEQEQQVATMQAQLADSEQHAAIMQSQLAEREQLVAKMRTQLAKKEQLAINLREQLAEWERTGRLLTEQLSEKERIEQEKQTVLEQQKRKYEEDLSQKVHISQTLLSRIAKKEDELERIEKEKREVITQLEISAREANSFSSQLWEIKHSRAWYVIQLIWKLRIRFFPSGSIQTRFIRAIVNSLQSLKHNGLISFFKRVQTTKSDTINQKQEANPAPIDAVQKVDSSVSLVHPNPIYISSETLDTTRPYFDASTSSIHPDDPTGLHDRVIGCLKYSDFLISISHDDYLTINFGVQMFITNEQNLYDKRKISYIHLYPINGADYLIDDSPLVLGLNVDSKHIGIFSVNDIVTLLENLPAKKYTCASLNLHQFKGWTLNALSSIISVVHPNHLLFYIHDFFAVCPQYTLLWNQREFCNAPPLDSNVCNICIFIDKRKKHLPLVKHLFTRFPFLIIAPSKSTTTLWQKTFPELNNKMRIEPHILLKESSAKLPIKSYRTIRIAYAGQGVRQKGWDFWRSLVDKFAPYADYEFFHFGSRVGQYRELFERVRVTPENRTAMLDALRKKQIDVLFHWSIVPETFSYVLYEAIGAGCFVLTTSQSGNVADYITENKNGLVFETFNDLVEYLSTPDNLRKDLLDFRKKYPRSFTLEHNDTIANLVKMPNYAKSEK